MRASHLLFVLVALTAQTVGAQEIPPSPIVKTEFLLDAPSVAPGDTVWAGIRFTIPEHWHIYWRNPGDSGIATRLAFTLPKGMEAGSIQWPAPARIPLDDMVNYGYSREVVLPVPLQVNADNRDYDIDVTGGAVHVKADWLVCRDICIPESASFSLPLPHTDAAAHQAIAAARAAAPEPLMANARFAADDQTVTLSVPVSDTWKKPATASFIPQEDGIIPNNAEPEIDFTRGALTLRFPRGSGDNVAQWHGVLNLSWANGEQAHYALTAERQDHIAAALPAWPLLLLLAFAGGLLLNIMPCVLPILSLKALALVKKATAAPRAARAQGIAYTLGVVLSFVAIAGVMLALKASGSVIGWGFQLQSPVTVAILATLMVAVSLNLLGMLKVPVLFGHVMVEGDGVRGTFLTGALAVAVATPCTAPFMATAIGATLTLPAAASLLVFSAMGFGMASPFLLISLWPAARRILPKPGAWMHRFRQVLAIPMMATAAWLIYVLVQLVYPTPIEQKEAYTLITPIDFDAGKLAELRAAGQPVLVDATAAWCLTCKVNERVALRPTHVQQFLADHYVTLMIADWTARDPAITDYLATFGRNGVPLVVFYPKNESPVVLPQVLTPGVIMDTLSASVTEP